MAPTSSDDANEIRNLIARLSRNADTGDEAAYLSSFADDAEWNLPGAAVVGIDMIREALRARRERGEAGPGTATRHMVSTVDVVVDGDRAEAMSYFQFFVDTTTTPALRSVGEYSDVFVRTAEGWKLRRRDIVMG